MLIFGVGEIGANLSWNMATGFLLFYYTDVARIPVEPLAWLFLLTKLLDAFIDIGAGRLVDRTRSRWGHARPYLLFAAVPFGVACSLVFMVPDVDAHAKVIYAFITYTLLGLCYSFLYVPYGALQSLLSSDARDHAIIGGLRSAGTAIGSIGAYFFAQRLVELLGGGSRGWGATAMVYSSISVLLFLIVFSGTRERVTTHPAKVQLGTVLRQMLRNRVWVSAFLLMMVNVCRVITLVSVLPYAARMILGNTAMLGALLTLQSAAILTGSLLAGPLINRFTSFRVNVAGVVLAALMFALLPFVEGRIFATLVMFTVASFPVGIFNSTAFAGCSIGAGLHESRFGNRSEGLFSSGLSFGAKAGAAIGSAVIALLLSRANYNPDLITHDVDVVVRFGFYWLQIGLLMLHLPAIAMLRRGAVSK